MSNRRRRREQILAEEEAVIETPVVLTPPCPPKTLGFQRFRFCVSFLPCANQGGSHQFTLTLLKYFQNRGIFANNIFVDNNTNQVYDLLFVVADLARSIEYIKHKKNEGLKIVHRVDGCFYDHGFAPGSERDLHQRGISQLVDLVIYQSQYGKTCLEDKGIIDRDRPSVIIYNGVDRAVYKPVLHRLAPTLTLLSANKSRLRIKRVDRLNEFVQPKVQVMHVGQYHPSVLLNKGVQVSKPVAFDKLSRFFNASHAFIHTGDKDTCPNVVIQALSTGLPVIYWKSSGGVPELAGNAGLAVEDYASIKDLLQDLRDNYSTYHNNALTRAKLFDIQVIGQQYYDVFRKVLSGVTA